MTAVLPPRQVLADISRPVSRQLAVCPHCLNPVAGLLAGCQWPTCRALELAEDFRLAQLED